MKISDKTLAAWNKAFQDKEIVLDEYGHLRMKDVSSKADLLRVFAELALGNYDLNDYFDVVGQELSDAAVSGFIGFTRRLRPIRKEELEESAKDPSLAKNARHLINAILALPELLRELEEWRKEGHYYKGRGLPNSN